MSLHKTVCTLMLLCGSVFGQVVSSNLVGMVTDPAGASIPSVEIQLKDQATGAVRATISGAEELFRLTNMQPGTYTLSIHAQGFKAYTQQAINPASS